MGLFGDFNARCFCWDYPVKKRTSSSSTSCSLTGFYQNCRGLRTKLSTFKRNVSALNYSFIILTETWLSENFLNCELGLLNYNVYRYDRCNLTSLCTRGGGVLIGIRKDIRSSLISISFQT